MNPAIVIQVLARSINNASSGPTSYLFSPRPTPEEAEKMRIYLKGREKERRTENKQLLAMIIIGLAAIAWFCDWLVS
jgi:hypothetical protein